MITLQLNCLVHIQPAHEIGGGGQWKKKGKQNSRNFDIKNND